jgi:putative endonuclease
MVGIKSHNLELGAWGEQLAEAELVKAGATVLERNYRGQNCEIDLLVEHEDDLVAVEVKTRAALDLEKPEEAVTWWKLRRIVRGLKEYAFEAGYMEHHWRIDVVAIELDLDGQVQRCEHIRDAFPP